MTWIKTISVEDDEKVRRAVEAQRDLYPAEYSIPIHPTADAQASQIVASRLADLLDKNREEGLTPGESTELDVYELVQHSMIRLKTRARQTLF